MKHRLLKDTHFMTQHPGPSLNLVDDDLLNIPSFDKRNIRILVHKHACEGLR